MYSLFAILDFKTIILFTSPTKLVKVSTFKRVDMGRGLSLGEDNLLHCIKK